MFCDELGCPIQPNWLTKRFSTLRATAGIATGSLHILRHTAATLALTASPRVPLHIVAGRLCDDPRSCSASMRICCRARTRRPRKHSPQFSLTSATA